MRENRDRSGLTTDRVFGREAQRLALAKGNYRHSRYAREAQPNQVNHSEPDANNEPQRPRWDEGLAILQ